MVPDSDGGGPGSSGDYPHLPGSTDHSCHRQQKGKQNEGKLDQFSVIWENYFVS